MKDLYVLLTLISIFFAVYKVFELFVRRKERMTIIEKMHLNENIMDNRMLTNKLNLPLFGFKKLSSSWPLRASLLMIGVGLGLITGFFIENIFFSTAIHPQFSEYNWDVKSNIQNTVRIIYFACILLFGGAGLLMAYFVERKNEKENSKNYN